MSWHWDFWSFPLHPRGNTIDHTVPVAGFVMRVAVIFLWLRAARQEQPRRQACPAYAVTKWLEARTPDREDLSCTDENRRLRRV